MATTNVVRLFLICRVVWKEPLWNLRPRRQPDHLMKPVCPDIVDCLNDQFILFPSVGVFPGKGAFGPDGNQRFWQSYGWNDR